MCPRCAHPNTSPGCGAPTRPAAPSSASETAKAAESACTLRPSRKLLPHLSSHRLTLVTAELGIDAFTHHDALDDARAAAQLALALAERFECADLRDLGAAVGGAGTAAMGQAAGIAN